MNQSRHTTRDTVVEELRVAMARRRVSQDAVRRRLGISRDAMTRRMTGRTAFSVEELVKAAEFLDVPLTSLVAPPQHVA